MELVVLLFIVALFV